jgi:beta-xylosidase
MRADLLSVESKRVELIHPDKAWEHGVTEAPTVVYRNGLYHLFYSAGPYQGSKEDCKYCVAHAVSKSLLGPYAKDEKPLLESVAGEVYGPGHQCILTMPDGQMWMFYHGWSAENQPRYGSNRAGRTLRVDRLTWRGDTPHVEGPTVTPKPAPKLRPQTASLTGMNANERE